VWDASMSCVSGFCSRSILLLSCGL
jgi:hypothetical protein